MRACTCEEPTRGIQNPNWCWACGARCEAIGEAQDINPEKNYILIEVRERPDRLYGTDAGDIRKVIHEYSKERGFNVADMIFREDQTRVPFLNRPTPYPQIREIFESITNAYKKRFSK